MRASAATVTVVGSLNVDIILNVPRLPSPGETLAATSLTRRLGGKGANQALAAARQGARVTMIGCVGDDADGRSYLDHLRREKVTVSTMKTVRGEGTGVAMIAVNETGENQIIVHPGANAHLTATTVRSQRPRIAVASALLIQLEIPLDTVVAAIEIANDCKVPVVHNPSPPNPDFPWGQVTVDLLIVNEAEAQQLFALNPAQMSSKPAAWLKAMADKKVGSLIVTRGAHSTFALHRETFIETLPHVVEPIDTVGAGDAFAGAFTAQFYAGKPFEEALRWANVAAALSTLKPGAQEGIPMAGDVIVALGHG